jgi:hypothetical protein
MKEFRVGNIVYYKSGTKPIRVSEVIQLRHGQNVLV